MSLRLKEEINGQDGVSLYIKHEHCAVNLNIDVLNI